MENHVSQQNNFLLPGGVGDGSFGSKRLRLFGFEVDLYAKGADLQSRSEQDETVNSPDAASSKTEKIAEKPKQNKYECRFCLKGFASSQALGGHQNAHKKERLEKKRLQLRGKKGSYDFYFQPLQDDVGFNHHDSSHWLYDSALSSIPEFMLCKEAQISFRNPQASASTLPQPFRQDTCLQSLRHKHNECEQKQANPSSSSNSLRALTIQPEIRSSLGTGRER